MSPFNQAERLLELYRGREDVFAHHDPDAGHYVPVHRALTVADLEAHLNGGPAVGIYPIRNDDTVLVGDADIDKAADPQATRADAERVRAELVLMGIRTEATLLSFSGSKGHHVDVFCDQPISPGIMRRLIAVACSRAGVTCEVFPKQDTRLGSEKELGNLFKLPLCHHPKTGNVAEILDHHTVQPESAGLIHGIVAGLRGEELKQAVKTVELPDPSDPERTYSEGQREPRLTQMVRGLNRHGIDTADILTLAIKENAEHFKPPHEERYVKAKVADLLKRFQQDRHTATDAALRRRSSGAELLDLAGASAAPATAQQEAPVLQVTFPTLPNDFWDSRASLRAIRQAAYSRTRSADAVLGVVLARLAALVPHQLRIPAIVGAPAPLNLLVSITGPAGSGKGTSQAIGRQLIPHDPVRVAGPLPLGSGEGLAESFFTYITDPEDPRKKIKFRNIFNAFATADEGQVLEQLGARSGSTLLPTLRTGFSGETLGQTNAANDRRRIVVAGSYSLGVTINLQPQLCGSLLDDTAAGTPQRIIWTCTIDPSIPDVQPDWPARDLIPQRTGDLIEYFLDVGPTPRFISVPQSVKDEVRSADLRRTRGDIAEDPWTAHHDLVRLKVAALLAVLDNRLDMTIEDWQLATVLKVTSDAVRDSVRQVVAAQAETQERQLSRRQAHRQLAATELIEDHAEAKRCQAEVDCAEWIREKVKVTPGTTAADVRRLGSKKVRSAWDDGLAHALAAGWIHERRDPGQGQAKRALYPGAAK